MSRPKDEKDRPLPPPHKRLANAHAVEQAVVFAISEDGRAAHLILWRKLKIARKAIDHLVDGDTPPAWLFVDKNSQLMPELWQLALRVARPLVR